TEAGEWYIFTFPRATNPQGIITRNTVNGGLFYQPTPFGNDLYAQFGDEFGLPVPGNFDPPVTSPQVPGSLNNSQLNVDVDNDGFVSPIDALLVINKLNS